MTTAAFPPKIGKYDVLGIIGRGGMGVVYQAMDPHLDRRVAIKMITAAFSENSDMLKRFFREAQSLGSLQHPNIVTVFDLGDFHGNPYFVMEYLEGEGLDSVLSSRRQLNLLEKISIVVQVCSGLGYAHRRGVIHRDIKPANIMISKDGGVKIFDFGIAHAGQNSVTRTGEVLGTLRYMAPEQVNSKGVDSRTDLFATGVVLYQLITDHLPFDGDNTAATLMKIVNEAPPPLSNFLSVFPPEIEQILGRALAKNPDDRYESADEFAFELVQLQGQLKEELIGREMDEIVALIDRGDMNTAQGSLLRVLRIDQQHTKANRLLREVQQRIQRDEIGKQVRDQKERAEEAMADGQFDRALELADRQHQVEERRPLVDGLVSESRALFQAGRLEELKDKLERAIAHLGPEPRLQSLLGVVGERIQREQVLPASAKSPQESLDSAANTVGFSATQVISKGENRKPPDVPVSAVPAAEHRDKGGPHNAPISSHGDMHAAPFDRGTTRLQPGMGGEELNEASLQALERHLASFIGPLARVLVKRAASKATSLDELYSLLSANVEREEDRKAFLAKRNDTFAGKTGSAFTKVAPVPAVPLSTAPKEGSTPGDITAAVIEQATRSLASFLGPLAPIVARKDSKRAANLAEFYGLLAAHIVDLPDRERFLTSVGMQKDATASSFLGRDKTGSR